MSKYDLPIRVPPSPTWEQYKNKAWRDANPNAVEEMARNFAMVHAEVAERRALGILTPEEITQLAEKVAPELYALAGVLLFYSEHPQTHLELVKQIKPALRRMRQALRQAGPLI